MSKGEYDDHGRGYDAGREAAADEIERLRKVIRNLCSVIEAEGEHFPEDGDGCPICNALYAAHAALK